MLVDALTESDNDVIPFYNRKQAMQSQVKLIGELHLLTQWCTVPGREKNIDTEMILMLSSHSCVTGADAQALWSWQSDSPLLKQNIKINREIFRLSTKNKPHCI